MCAIPMRLAGDEWETWMPERDDPLYQRFKLLADKTMGMTYQAQKTLLEQLYQQAGDSVFVSEFTAVRHETEGNQTFCVWSEDVDSLLPKTDLVFFYRRGEDYGRTGEAPTIGKWDNVQAAFGDLMEPLDMYPPRFRVREFPARLNERVAQ